MKVIGVDNFGRETVADHLVAEGLSDEEAKRMCDELNTKHGGEGAFIWYRVMPDDYRLWRGMEDLI